MPTPENYFAVETPSDKGLVHLAFVLDQTLIQFKKFKENYEAMKF